ncbi:MAG: radical SAM protein [Polyangiaceae bacterium]|nr:radical SAM protein [Polyangiaceae bacterium]
MSAGVPWSRPEPFGAWVRLDDATLVAVDHELAARLGVAHGAERPGAGPLELHVAVTSRCPAGCEGCYLDARPDGGEPSFEELCARLAAAREAGASTVALGGGEPLLRRDLGQLAEEARALGLVPVMTTSGLGLTAARAAELRAFAQVNVSHDGAGEGYEAVRGYAGAAAAERAIALLAGAGVPVGVNVVLTRATFELLRETAARAAGLGARELPLLRYKPAGRAAGAGYEERRLTPAQVARLWGVIAGLVGARALRVRIDCAMVPLLSASLLEAVPRAAEALDALGVFGCEAARHLGALRADGSGAPCSFFSIGEAPDGSPAARRLPVAARPGERARLDAAALRAYHAAPPEPCASCPLRPVCRGGCQVVSRHERGGLAPDPECPRVLAHHAAPQAAARSPRASTEP